MCALRRFTRNLPAAGCLLGITAAVVGFHVAAADAAVIDGAWTYFVNPRAVYADGVTYFGLVTSRGDVRIGALTDQTGRIRLKTLSRRFGVDDHDSPSLWVRPDGRIVAFWSPHSGYHLPRGRISRLFYRISCAPRRIQCFGRVHRINGNTGHNRLGFTYPSNVYSAATRTLWLFWRGGDWQPTYARSRDRGQTWTRPRTLVRGGRKVYAVYADDAAGGFHVAITPDNPSVSANSIYYLHYRRGRWLRADGRVIGRLRPATNFRRGDAVFQQASVRASNCWVLDVAQQPDGLPVVLYRLSADELTGYWYARWTGQRWTSYRIARSGTLHGYNDGQRLAGTFGGAVLDHDDPNIVYLSKVHGTTAEIDGAVTADGGAHWRLTPITRGSRWPNIRPVTPLGLDTGMVVLWMSGPYRRFDKFHTDIRAVVEPTPPTG